VDTSALAKYYVTEVGSAWISSLISPVAGNVIVICDLTTVEFFSILARYQRENKLMPANALLLQSGFLADYENEYLSIPLENNVLSHARDLINRYPLRSLDAIQLACAVVAVNTLAAPMVFISGDGKLLNAAAGEGFSIDNPNAHP
jgi:predicted nucleic acid-binding protein